MQQPLRICNGARGVKTDEDKGKFTEAQSEGNRFPPELIGELEEMIYQSLDSSLHKISWEEIQESIYFETIEKFGATDFALNLEDMRTLFPELKNGETENVYEAYKLVSGDPNCQEIFRYVNEEKEYYVFVTGTGGSAGITNVKLTQRINNDFVLVSEFDTQNSGYGRVIQFEDDFYYIFLEYNYL